MTGYGPGLSGVRFMVGARNFCVLRPTLSSIPVGTGGKAAGAWSLLLEANTFNFCVLLLVRINSVVLTIFNTRVGILILATLL